MEKLQIPQGKATYFSNKNSCEVKIGSVEFAIDIHDIGISHQESESLARLFVSAITAYQQCETLPSELLSQNREMREALIHIQKLAKMCDYRTIQRICNEGLTSCVEQGKE